MGKGDKRRPSQVPDKGYGERWDKAFKKPNCLVCGRTHRNTPYCCYECQQSDGETHSIGCDITWREENE